MRKEEILTTLMIGVFVVTVVWMCALVSSPGNYQKIDNEAKIISCDKKN